MQTVAKKSRATLKRPELFVVHKLLDERLTVYPNKLCRYKDEKYSDKEVAELATQKIKKEIDEALIARVRITTFGKLPHESGAKAEVLAELLRRVDALAAKLKALEDKFLSLEKELYDDPAPHSQPVKINGRMV